MRIRAASSRPGTQPHHPQKQRPFLSQAGDFITHSRTAGAREASLFRQAWDKGWESRGRRTGPAPAERRQEERVGEGEPTSRALVATQNPLCVWVSAERGLVSSHTSLGGGGASKGQVARGESRAEAQESAALVVPWWGPEFTRMRSRSSQGLFYCNWRPRCPPPRRTIGSNYKVKVKSL